MTAPAYHVTTPGEDVAKREASAKKQDERVHRPIPSVFVADAHRFDGVRAFRAYAPSAWHAADYEKFGSSCDVESEP